MGGIGHSRLRRSKLAPVGFSLANNNQTNGGANGTLNINIGGTVQTNSDILLGAAVGPQ